MPKIEILSTLEVTPQRFLEACSSVELQELDMLICSPHFRKKMNHKETFKKKNPKELPNEI